MRIFMVFVDGNMFDRNVVNDIPDYTKSDVRRRLAYNHHSKNYMFHCFCFWFLPLILNFKRGRLQLFALLLNLDDEIDWINNFCIHTLLWLLKPSCQVTHLGWITSVFCKHSYIYINPLKPELNPICYLLALLGAHHFLHFSRIRVKLLTLKGPN